MSGLLAMVTSFRNRRPPLNHSRWIDAHRARLIACSVFVCAVMANRAFSQAQGTVRITLDEAIQMAAQHNHNLLAARTTIQQSQAEEITANLRPNPTLFGDWEYLPLFSPSNQNSAYRSEEHTSELQSLRHLVCR